MNIIIVGCGKVGQKLAEQLSGEKEHNITVVDLLPSEINNMVTRFDVMGVTGSGSNLETLEEAGIKDADLLIAVTESDEVNLLTCLIAKKAGDCKTIARVRKPEYGREVELFKEDLGLALIINPEQTAASEIARAIRFPSAVQIDTFVKGRVEILKFRIAKGSVLSNMKISEMSTKLRCDVLVCGVERSEQAFIPGGDFVLKEGDFVSIVASPENGTFFFKQIGLKTDKITDTMIVGGGATAFYLAKRLIRDNIKVKIIEKNPARCEQLCTLLPEATVLCGDGTDNSVLIEEGLENAQSFVALTNIDEENILLSLFARKRSNAKVITKINRIAYDDVIGGLDLDTMVYPKNITAEYIVRFVRATNNSVDSNIETMHLILDGKAEALEFKITANSPVKGKTIESLKLKNNIILACIYHNGKVIIPRGQTTISEGDSVIVVTTHRGFNDIDDIME